MKEDRSSVKSRWIMFAKLGVIALVTWGIYSRFYSQIHELDSTGRGFSRLWEQLDLAWLMIAAAAYLGGLLPPAWFWHRLLILLGQRAQWTHLLRAYYIGHLGKYVPGKALVVVLRVGMLPGVDKAVATVTVFYETLTMMAAGSLAACVVLAVGLPKDGWLFLLALGLTFVTGLPVLPAVFRQVYRRMGVSRLAPNMGEQVARVGGMNLLLGMLVNAGGWVLMGISLWATLRALGSGTASLADLPIYTACVALSLVAGFVSFIPGGFGVREWVLMELLAPRIGTELAFESTILLRLVWLLAELAISAILYGVKGKPTHALGGDPAL